VIVLSSRIVLTSQICKLINNHVFLPSFTSFPLMNWITYPPIWLTFS
jgi:hypothetical protein